MKINVKLFAFLAEKVGTETTVELPANTTVTALKQAIADNDLQLANVLADSRVAINQEFVNNEQLVLTASDEVAIIPPVSGG